MNEFKYFQVRSMRHNFGTLWDNLNQAFAELEKAEKRIGYGKLYVAKVNFLGRTEDEQKNLQPREFTRDDFATETDWRIAHTHFGNQRKGA